MNLVCAPNKRQLIFFFNVFTVSFKNDVNCQRFELQLIQALIQILSRTKLLGKKKK